MSRLRAKKLNGRKVGARSFVIEGTLLLLCATISAREIAGQTVAKMVATVDVPVEAVRALRLAECGWKVAPAAVGGDTAGLTVRIVNRVGSDSLARAPVNLVVSVGADSVGILPFDKEAASFPVSLVHLRQDPVRIRAGGSLICQVRVSAETATLQVGTARTSFIVDGGLANAFRGGSKDPAVTGGLGILHRDRKEDVTSLPKLIRRLLPSNRTGGERLKAVVTVASGPGTLTDDSARSPFAQAIVSPYTAAGQGGSGLIDYYAYADRQGRVGTQGPRVLLFVTRSEWKHVPARLANGEQEVPEDVERAADVTVVAFETRYRWSFVDRPSDDRENSFSFGVDVGPGLRWLSGDGAVDRDFLLATVGTTRTTFPVLATSFWVQLKSAMASVEAPYFFARKPCGDSNYPNRLRGLQPIIEIRLEAPLFTF